MSPKEMQIIMPRAPEHNLDTDDWVNEILELTGPESMGDVFYDVETELPTDIVNSFTTVEQLLEHALLNPEEVNPFAHLLLTRLIEEHERHLMARDKIAHMKYWHEGDENPEERFDLTDKLQKLKSARAIARSRQTKAATLN